MRMQRIAALLVLTMVAISGATAQTIGWRTDGTGIYPKADPPLTWSPTENVLYSQPMPNWGNAMPAITGDRMFFCAEPDILICAKVATGEILWQRTHPAEPPLPKKNKTNGYTSATPVTDGKVVCAVFGTGIVAVYDINGSMLWSKLIQKPKHQWGHSASPRLVGDTLVVSVIDVFGLDPRTGEQKWRAPSTAHWGTPAVTKIGNVDVIVTANGEVIRTDNGTVLATKLAAMPYGSPIVHDGVVYFVDEKVGRAVKLPQRISESMEFKVLWNRPPTNKPTKRNDRYYASPVVHSGLLFVVTRYSVYSVLDAATGNVLLERALDLPKGTVYPSFVLAGGRLYLSHDSGITLVLEPSAEYKQLARNMLEPFRSTPVCVGSRMYIRGLKNLYCIGR